MFLDHKVYCLENLIYMYIMVKMLVVYKIIWISVSKYQNISQKI